MNRSQRSLQVFRLVAGDQRPTAAGQRRIRTDFPRRSRSRNRVRFRPESTPGRAGRCSTVGPVHALNGSSWLDGFFDDAAAFPPSSVPLDRAVAAFRAHQQAEAGPLVGNLVVPDVKLPDLIDVL